MPFDTKLKSVVDGIGKPRLYNCFKDIFNYIYQYSDPTILQE